MGKGVAASNSNKGRKKLMRSRGKSGAKKANIYCRASDMMAAPQNDYADKYVSKRACEECGITTTMWYAAVKITQPIHAALHKRDWDEWVIRNQDASEKAAGRAWDEIGHKHDETADRMLEKILDKWVADLERAECEGEEIVIKSRY